MTVSFIPPNVFPHVHEVATSLLESAVAQAHGRETIPDIWYRLGRGEYQLWMAFEDEDTPLGALVTRLEEYPNARMLNYLYVGGDDMASWHQEMLDILERFAKDNDCAGMEIIGRKGWERFMKKFGWETKHIVCEKFFTDKEKEDVAA